MAPFLSLMVIPNLRCSRTAAERANPIYHRQERRPMKLRALFPLRDWARPVSSSNAVTILGQFLSGRFGSGHHGVESLASRLTIPRNKSGIGNPTFLSLLSLMSLLTFLSFMLPLSPFQPYANAIVYLAVSGQRFRSSRYRMTEMTALKASKAIISPLLPHRLTCEDLTSPPRLKHRSL